MPLIQVDIPRPLFKQIGSQVSAEIHRALIEALEIPAAIGVRREDIQIAVTETHHDDWYAGRLPGE